MGSYFGLGKVQGPSIKMVVFTSFIGWIIKTIYVHVVGVIIFPSKNTTSTAAIKPPAYLFRV